MAFELEPLPWDEGALEEVISKRTIQLHYHKHHRGYVDKLNGLTRDTRQGLHSLESLVRTAESDLYNNAAQVWNHSFYWNCMQPGGGGTPSGQLLDVIRNTFGDFATFRHRLAEAANAEFGSGWAWLVKDKYGRLRIDHSTDAVNPLRQQYEPLLCIDVWEHAYYLDFNADRAAYVEGFIDKLINWDFVSENLQLLQQDEDEDLEAEESAWP